ncbi:MAG: hypothetical protein V6D39_15250 [Dolichospermum lemmermannii FEM_B0920]
MSHNSTKKMNCLQQDFAIQFCGIVLVLLAGKMPALQEILDISLIGSLLAVQQYGLRHTATSGN